MVAAVVVLAVPTQVHADVVPDDLKAKARTLFTDGNRHYNLAEYQQALADFKEGYRLSGDPAFLFNIAQCQRAAGDRAGAVVSYKAYLREVVDPVNKEMVEQHIAELEKPASPAPPPAGPTPARVAPPAPPTVSRPKGQPAWVWG